VVWVRLGAAQFTGTECAVKSAAITFAIHVRPYTHATSSVQPAQDVSR